jgi:iron complex transport system ATP-binding protein
MILQIDSVSFSYKPSAPPVLRDVAAEIESGTITAILGPNGAGKSTLLDICLGWKEPSSGNVLLHGHPLSSYSRNETGRLLSLVPQDEKIRFDYSVLEYTLLGRAPYLGQLEVPGEQELLIARDALEDTGISHLANRPITRLSGGEHQLLMISRALAQEPSLMLLDEPTSKLDLANSSRILDMMRKLSESGVTIIFTTHDPALAARVSTHLLLMKEGEVLTAGPMDRVLTGEYLSKLYDSPVAVHTIDGERVVIPKYR